MKAENKKTERKLAKLLNRMAEKEAHAGEPSCPWLSYQPERPVKPEEPRE